MFALLREMKEPEFLRELEQATRDYEKAVFGTDEVWDWAVREYRFGLPMSWGVMQ